MDRGSVFDPQQLYNDVAYTASPTPSPRHDDSLSPLSPNRQDSEKFPPSETKSSSCLTPVGSLQNDVPHWSPKLLHILPTSVFAAFILLLIIGLELFNRYSPYNAPSTGARFMWTYAPACLLMVVQWIWGAYDLQVKILVPWAAMSRGATPAQQGWLLDYIGGNQIIGVWTAVKYKHVIVLLTTLGLWSTALAGIVTTSLFKIQDSVQVSGASFSLATSLNHSLLTNFDPAILDDKNYLDSFLGRQLLNLSRPQWTTADDIVLEAFDSPGSVAELLIAQTQGYSARLDCKPAPVSYAGNVSIPANPDPDAVALFVNVDAAGCRVQYLIGDTNHLVLCYTATNPTCFLGRVYNHTCPGSTEYTTVSVVAFTKDRALATMSAAECSPSYSRYLVDVSVSPSASGAVNASIVSDSIDSAMMDGWSGMLQWLNSTNGAQRNATSASVSRQRDPFSPWGGVADGLLCDCDPWVSLIAHAQNLNISDLVDTATLVKASAESFPGVFSDVAQALFMATPPASTAPLSGTVQNTVRQLVARTTSVRIAQATLSLLLALVVAVYFLRPHTALPIDPSSMAAHAVLMASNHDEISAIIKDTITVTQVETQVLLNDWSFSVESQKEFRIIAQRRGTASPAVPKFVKAPVWRPMILHPVFKLVLCLMLIGTIIGLEMGLRKSQRNRGFADFTPSSQDSWTYVAPAYLFVLGILLSSYTFSVGTLEPFFAMHRSPQPARKSVRYSPATQTHAGLGLHAIRYRSLVGISCAMIMLTVPFLKIVVSGLITTTSEPAESSTVLAATSTFNTTPPDATNTDLPKLMLALSQIPKYQLPLPAWTTPAGAVAQLDTVRLGQVVQSPNTTLTLPLEVMRAALGDCSPLDIANPANSLLVPSDCSPDVLLPKSPGWFGRVCASASAGNYAFVYGKTQPTNASAIEDVTAVHCLSYTFSMATENVTLSYESDAAKILSIDTSARSTVATNISFPVDSPAFSVLLGQVAPPTFETNSSLAFDTLFQLMTLKDPSTPLETFLDPTKLTTAAQAIFVTYGAIFASLYQRIPIPVASQHPIEVAVDYQHSRIVQATAPTRILQVLLACVLAFGLITALTVHKTNNVLTKPPYSIGATMGLLADSAFLELPELRDVTDDATLDRAVEPYQFQLGWGNNPKGGMRFGVDIVAK